MMNDGVKHRANVVIGLAERQFGEDHVLLLAKPLIYGWRACRTRDTCFRRRIFAQGTHPIDRKWTHQALGKYAGREDDERRRAPPPARQRGGAISAKDCEHQNSDHVEPGWHAQTIEARDV